MHFLHTICICIFNVITALYLKYTITANSPRENFILFFFFFLWDFKWSPWFSLIASSYTLQNISIWHFIWDAVPFCHPLFWILRLRALFLVGAAQTPPRAVVSALIQDRTSAEWGCFSPVTEEIKNRARNRRWVSCQSRSGCVSSCAVCLRLSSRLESILLPTELCWQSNKAGGLQGWQLINHVTIINYSSKCKKESLNNIAVTV